MASLSKIRQMEFNTIPHDAHRYPTVGDWYREDGVMIINVSMMKDKRHELLVGIHEMIEAYLCEHRRITERSVSAFDRKFEKERDEGKHKPDDEPGDDPRAPYRKEHFFATNIERLLAAELGVDWKQYADEIESL